MATMDIFSNDAFGMIEMTDALDKVPHLPQRLSELKLFTPKPIRTEKFSIEKRDGKLELIASSARGAPLEQRARDFRSVRDFRTVRLAKGDVIQAAELQNIRAFGRETELMQVQAEVMGRMVNLRRDLSLTHEYHKLGAIQGVVLDAGGGTLYDWYSEWGISAPSAVDFVLGTYGDGAIRTKCTQIIRAMQRASKGAWVPGTRVHALCGDTFFDKLIANKETRETYLNQVNASQLREGAPRIFQYGGITFENYQGTDDNTTVAIGLTDAKFFPVGAPGVFEVAYSPAEFLPYVNTPGREYYAMVLPDQKRQAFVEVEVYSYCMHYCTRPEMLQAGTTSN